MITVRIVVKTYRRPIQAMKGSKSSKCSPVPRNTIGESVAATADNAPPPLACPSNFVMITDPIDTACLKDKA